MMRRGCSYSLKFLMGAALFFICFNAYAQKSTQFDSEKQIIAATKVESVFSSLLALETNPAKIKALKLAHKEWLALRKSHCAALTKDDKKLIECYEAFDTQRIETYIDQRISLLYAIPPQGTLPNNTIKIAYSQEHKISPPAPRSVTVAADAPVAAVSFKNDTTEIFDLVNGQLINRINTSYAKDKAFGDRFFLTPNGRILIWCVYMPKTELSIWDVKTGELLRHKTLPQYSQLPTSQVRYFIYADKDSIGIYDMIKGEVTWSVGKETDWTSFIALSPDDKYLIGVGARDHKIESWELVKAMDGRPSFVKLATEPTAESDSQPVTMAFANDDKSFYCTFGSLSHGLIVQRRLPDLKEMRRLRFPKLSFARLTQIKNTDIILMEAWIAYDKMEAFYVDMVGETAQRIFEHTGAHSKMAPLGNGQVLLATPYELKTLNVPSKAGFGKFGAIIGEVMSNDISNITPSKEIEKVIVQPQISCQKFQIEAIGIYEGTMPNNHSRRPGETIAGYVDVNIGHTDAPVKLVLSSYEPVIWRLHISSDARLSEIYLSGSNNSRVEGIQNIMVSYIGNTYAYENPNISSSRHGHTSTLSEVIEQKTGCHITNFQGVYRGSHFYIGSITKDISGKKEIYKYIDEKGTVIYRDY